MYVEYCKIASSIKTPFIDQLLSLWLHIPVTGTVSHICWWTRVNIWSRGLIQLELCHAYICSLPDCCKVLLLLAAMCYWSMSGYSFNIHSDFKFKLQFPMVGIGICNNHLLCRNLWIQETGWGTKHQRGGGFVPFYKIFHLNQKISILLFSLF